MDMVAQHFTQRCLQQMGGGVVAGNGHAVFLIHLSGQVVAHLHDTALQHAGVDVVALGGLLHIQHAQAAVGAVQHAVVRSLTAHLSVEGVLSRTTSTPSFASSSVAMASVRVSSSLRATTTPLSHRVS